MIDGLQKNDYLLMLIEECNECAQAAAKLIRIRDGRNSTPVSEVDAEKALIEEMADVKLCMTEAIESENISNQSIDMMVGLKRLRWRERQAECSAIPKSYSYHGGVKG